MFLNNTNKINYKILLFRINIVLLMKILFFVIFVMYWALFSTFILSLSRVFFKKTTQYNIKTELNDLLGHIGALLGVLAIIILWKFNVVLNDFNDYLLIFISFILFFITIKINQFIIREETISALIPYENLWKVLTVLFWVFLLNDTISNISLVMFLGVVVLILWFSLDLKHLTFSRNILLYCFAQLLTAIANLIIWYILINVSSLDYYSVYTFISLSFMVSICFYLKLYSNIKLLDRDYFISRGLSSLNWISWIISILLIKELWLSVTTLLSFLWIGISLISSYIIFKDIPSKKNILLTIAILILVWIWYLYK